ncbi:hypothetical protein D3C81_1627730 [compost metagenome]
MADLFTRNGTTVGELVAPTQIISSLAHVVSTLLDFGQELLDLVVLSACQAYCASEVRLGALILNFGVHGVQCDQRRVAIDMIGVVAVDCRYGTADLGGHLNHIAVDIGIVGGFAIQFQQVGNAQGNDHKDDGQDQQQCGAVRCSLLSGSGWGGRSCRHSVIYLPGRARCSVNIELTRLQRSERTALVAINGFGQRELRGKRQRTLPIHGLIQRDT